MEFLKILGLVLTYCVYSTATLTAHLNSDFRHGNQVNSQSSRAARRLVGLSSYPGSPEGLDQSISESHKTYDFDYKVSDGQGNMHYHKQETDGKGTVTGTYGYMDVHGLYRVVDYIADAKGFRAKIQTNEPGAEGRRSPAYIDMIAKRSSVDVRGGEAAPLRRGPVRGVEGERHSVPVAEDIPIEDNESPFLGQRFPQSWGAAVVQAFVSSYQPRSDGKDKDDGK